MIDILAVIGAVALGLLTLATIWWLQDFITTTCRAAKQTEEWHMKYIGERKARLEAERRLAEAVDELSKVKPYR